VFESERAVLVLTGATGSGKTSLAVELARTYGAEIVGADSRQIYRGMPVGTAMPSREQRDAVPHHLFDFLDPHERYSAARYAADAVAAINAIHVRGRRVIVVGGTGFYIRALTGGVDLAPQHDESLRRRLVREAQLHPPEFLYGWLAKHDPARAAALAPNDTYRVLRALEIALAPDSRHVERIEHANATVAATGVRWLTVFLDIPLDELDKRIAQRTNAMLAGGLVEEAERIGADAVAASAVGYPQALAYLRGWSSEDELQATLERATRRYARRQRTWFRGEPGTLWLAPAAVEAAIRENLRWGTKPL
jgi:tRNA dimethylallyltransferase